MKRSLIIMFLVTSAILSSCSRQILPMSRKNFDKTPPYQRVHFYFDSVALHPGEFPKMDENIDWLKRHERVVIILEGHCDEVGSSGYNMELGDRRARAVKAHLIEGGIDHERVIMVVSLGENRPIDEGHNFEAWKANRRVEFIIR